MTDTPHDPFRGREVVKSDRRLAEERAEADQLGEVPELAGEVVDWIEDGDSPDERTRRAALAAQVEDERSSPRVSVQRAVDAALADGEAEDYF